MCEIKKCIETIVKSGDYEVIRILKEQLKNFKPIGSVDESTLSKVCILDTETTGLDYQKDEIIEIAFSIITFDSNGNMYDVVETFHSYQEPEIPISEKITQITGITNEDVEGKSIDWQAVESLIKSADMIVAYNSGFDRKFVENYCPAFINKFWACAMKDVDWAEKYGCAGKQEFVAWKVGKFSYVAHNAPADVNALSVLLSTEVDGKTIFLNLLENIRTKKFMFKAFNAAFDKKDLLRSHGYSWNPDEKVWGKIVLESCEEEESKWLSEIIYNNSSLMPTVNKVTHKDLYSVRV